MRALSCTSSETSFLPLPQNLRESRNHRAAKARRDVETVKAP